MGQQAAKFFLSLIVQFLTGIFCIYIINGILALQGIDSGVGINKITMLVSAFLGMPGIAFTYIISWYCMWK